MKRRAIVLGCGLVGTTIVEDLAADPDFEVTATDISDDNLAHISALPRVTTLSADLGNPDTVGATVQDYDVVIGALPSRLGFQTLKTVIEAGKPYCDISFMPEDALTLDAPAKQHDVTAVVDCGVSPGLSNLSVGRAHAQLDRADRVIIYVGGLPITRRWPYDYKAPIAPSDVIEEYTRPARMAENGNVLRKPALSEPELIDFPRIGTLEAFNTDGLRSLIQTLDIPNMKEKTLRYPGHVELMRVLRETGFFDKNLIDINGVKVRPLDVTSRLLFPKWKFDESEAKFTVMRVIVEGRKGNRSMRYTYELYDETDRTNGTSSMARTTGFPCTIIARMVAGRQLAQPGVFPLELLARREGLFDHIIKELSARGVKLTEKID